MKKNYKYTIAVDIDGVIADFEGEFCERFFDGNRHLSNLHRRVPTIDKEIIDEFVNDPDVYDKLLPIFGGILLLRQAEQFGFYTLLMTSRPKHLAEVTRDWLEGYEIPHNEIWYAKNKAVAIQEYNTMYPNRPIKMLVDDIVENLVGLPDGVVGVAWKQPWNEVFVPSAQYNPEFMRLEIFHYPYEGWKPFWENENE